MMHKQRIFNMILCVILLLLFSGCITQNKAKPTFETQNILDESETIIENTTVCSTNSEYEEWKDIIANPLDGEGMVPLLFVNAQTDAGSAYLICAGNNGEVYRADRFTYDGAPLYSTDGYGRLEDQDRPSTTEIFDFAQTLQFVDPSGAVFTGNAESLTTTGRIYDSFVMAQAYLSQPVPADGKFYLGTYEGDGMFPNNAVYSNNGITIDLDNNGTTEQISWALTQKEYVEDPFFDYSGYLYDYILTVDQDGISHTVISSAELDWVGEGDFQVFLADVDQDHVYEIVVYKKICLRFDDISIYDYDGTSYVRSLVYTITPMS